MRLFNRQTLPSHQAQMDLDQMIALHEVRLHALHDYVDHGTRRSQVGFTLGAVSSLTGFGAVVAAGAGALSAAIIPLVLPIAVVIGVGALASTVVNRFATQAAAKDEHRIEDDLHHLLQVKVASRLLDREFLIRKLGADAEPGPVPSRSNVRPGRS